MFALVESGSITKMMNGNKGVTIGDNQYPASIFTLWSESERNAIGVYSVEIDSSNKKDEAWYNNTGITYAYDSSAKKVKGTYGTAIAKAHADTLYTDDDVSKDVYPDDYTYASMRGKRRNTWVAGDVAIKGLKSLLIDQVKAEAQEELSKTDWYVTRKADTDEALPSSIATHRAAVRTKQASMETSITNASDTPALQTLFTYTTNSDTGAVTRPIGEIPKL